jgi:hypothetical protein
MTFHYLPREPTLSDSINCQGSLHGMVPLSVHEIHSRGSIICLRNLHCQNPLSVQVAYTVGLD